MGRGAPRLFPRDDGGLVSAPERRRAGRVDGHRRSAGPAPTNFSDSFDRGDLGTIRLISYPGFEVPVHTFSAANANSGDHAWTYSDDEDDDDDVCKADVGIAPHTDFEAFTLMHQDAPGLQLLSRTELEKGKDGAWIDAPVVDAFIVIVGDILERYTNGVLRATPHRVVGGRPRDDRSSGSTPSRPTPSSRPCPSSARQSIARDHGRAHGDDAQLEEGRAVVGRGDEHEPVGDVRPMVRVKVLLRIGMGVIPAAALRTKHTRVSPRTKPTIRSRLFAYQQPAQRQAPINIPDKVCQKLRWGLISARP